MRRLSMSLFLMFSTLEAMKLENIYIQEENDALCKTDGDYTDGMRISTIFSVNETESSNIKNKLSFAIGQEMYTPWALSMPNVITNDRPYAGYRYLQSGLHQFEENSLDAVYLLFGTVGPRSDLDSYQIGVHGLLKVTEPEGWKNQIHNEWIYQINYEHMDFYNLSKTEYGNIDFVPNWSIQFGNATRKIKAGVKLGWRSLGMSKNFYAQSSRGGFEGRVEKDKDSKGIEGFVFGNTGIAVTDIFLDGNTDGNSHHVEKETFVSDFGLGIMWKSENWTLSLMNTWKTPEHKYNDPSVRYIESTIRNTYINNSYLHSWSSLVIGYNF